MKQYKFLHKIYKFRNKTKVRIDKSSLKTYNLGRVINMFFETNDFSANQIAAFEFNWSRQRSTSGLRPYHALSIRLKGNAEFIHKDKTVKVTTGDILFVPAFYDYTLDSEDEELLVIHFNSPDNLPKTIKKFTPKNKSFYERYFYEIYSSWTKKQSGYQHECRHYFHKLVMHIEREYKHGKLQNPNKKIAQTLEYIHSNFTDQLLTVSSLAKRCNVSETYFRKLFFENYQITPLEYINNLRTEYAIELLESGYYNVTEVAEKCGFGNAYYFSTFIKKRTGHSPKKFIKEYEI